MRRVVLDPGVLVSALITPSGAPARLLCDARGGELELIVSPLLLAELDGVLRREKFRRYVALKAADLLDLAFSQKAILVSGDKHLLELGGGAPILAPSDLAAARS